MLDNEFNINPDILAWLVEDSNPSVRYYTLIDLLDRSEAEQEVRDTRVKIMKDGIVPNILAKQNKSGYWETPEKYYTAKYKGTVWQLIILAELGADGTDERIKNACEFILNISQDKNSGGFSFKSGKAGALQSSVIPCLTGNMLWSLIRFGYLNDERVQAGIKWVIKYQRFDDGIENAPAGWPYDQWDMCWGKHSCHMSIVKNLKAFSEIPEGERNDDVKRVLNQAAEFLLKHHIYKRSHDLSRVSKPGWLRFGFPLMYQTDVLEIMDILMKLGYYDERMQAAVKLIRSRQNDDEKWLLSNTFNGRFQTNIEQKGKPSKWITLHALRVLKKYHILNKTSVSLKKNL